MGVEKLTHKFVGSSPHTFSMDDTQIRQQIAKALQSVERILANNRVPQIASDVSHTYDDKFLLAEFLTNTSIAAQLNALEALGLNSKALQTMLEWVQSRSVTIRLVANEQCSFVRETTRQQESKTAYVTEYESSSGSKATVTDKVVTTITEYFWNFQAEYELFAFQGVSPDNKLTLCSRKGSIELLTTTKSSPRSSSVVREPIDLNVTWLLQQISKGIQTNFSIDRKASSCHTPRRNSEIDRALGFHRNVAAWQNRISTYFRTGFFSPQTNHGLDMSVIGARQIFLPVVALFEEKASSEPQSEPSSGLVQLSYRQSADGPAVIMPVQDLNRFLDEQKRTIAEQFARVSQTLPHDKELITAAEGNILSIMDHFSAIAESYSSSIEFIETMLRQQLVAAIGKEVNPTDFAEYMTYHYRKLFKDIYAPQQFCYAIRRPDHYPEGEISIEEQHPNGDSLPISTILNWEQATCPMRFALNAATKVSIWGDRFLHSWMGHQFSGQGNPTLSLTARARQFSSFIVLLGTVLSADEFKPKYAVIIKNKDSLKIPLDLETIPTAKEFRDAIESLSPEQQRFARAFRSMQLESTMFAICVIQIKPQLEKLLNLPDDSLTKEIKLTQDLENLFIEYQIPSDLLSFTGDADAPVNQKLDFVRQQVAQMNQMIADEKKRKLAEKEQERLFAEQQQRQAYPLSTTSSIDYLSYNSPMMPQMSYGCMPVAQPMMQQGFAFGSAAPMAAPMSYASPSMSGMAANTFTSFSQNAPGGPRPGAVSGAKPAPVDKPAKHPGEQVSEDVTPQGQVDYTKIPAQLDQLYLTLDPDAAVRPTIIKPGKLWQKTYRKSLLSDEASKTLTKSEQKKEKNTAFDLLDALTRSGVLSVDQASFHVVLGATHCFDATLMNTVIQQNINPIERVERSILITSTVIHAQNPAVLLRPSQLERVQKCSPSLFTSE